MRGHFAGVGHYGAVGRGIFFSGEGRRRGRKHRFRDVLRIAYCVLRIWNYKLKEIF
jgi:hypothetical protein